MSPKRSRTHEALDEWNSMTPSQAARFLGVTRQTIYSRVLRGELRAERVGAHVRIARGALEESRTTAPRPTRTGRANRPT